MLICNWICTPPNKQPRVYWSGVDIIGKWWFKQVECMEWSDWNTLWPSGKLLHNYGNSHVFNGKSHDKWPFSIASSDLGDTCVSVKSSDMLLLLPRKMWTLEHAAEQISGRAIPQRTSRLSQRGKGFSRKKGTIVYLLIRESNNCVFMV